MRIEEQTARLERINEAIQYGRWLIARYDAETLGELPPEERLEFARLWLTRQAERNSEKTEPRYPTWDADMSTQNAILVPDLPEGLRESTQPSVLVCGAEVGGPHFFGRGPSIQCFFLFL